MLSPGTTFDTKSATVRILSLLGKGKSGYSYLVECRAQHQVLKLMHDEPCAYYTFGDKTQSEIHAYARLRRLGLPLPALLEFDEQREYLLKEYIAGPTAAELIAADAVPAAIFAQLFAMAELLQRHQLNIDYFPTNFVVNDTRLYYVDYEMNPYLAQWDLCNWGIYYWINTAGMKRFLETGDHLAINQQADSGLPIKHGLQERTQELIATFAGRPA